MNDKEINSYLLNSRTAINWKKIGTKRRAGIAVPLFSLYSKTSTGIGELTDLVLLAEWCLKTGISIIQLLPLNDVGSDFAPYSSVSSFAIDPMYLNLNKLNVVLSQEQMHKLEILRKKFRPLFGRVNYKIKNCKIEFLWDIYKGRKTDDIVNYTAFKNSNKYWLHDYAVYKVIAENNISKGWVEWQEGLREFSIETTSHFEKLNYERIEFYKWIQWQLYEQFCEVKNVISKKGILIMGDIPFLVSRESADVWAHQNYFHLQLSAGAPPDMYFAMGQKWGMPPYNWNAIANDGFTYLKEKLKYAENFYDMYRIDHFVGLFRVWVSPANDFTKPGSFMPKEEYLWEAHGRKIIDAMLSASQMLPCGEDLGTVPACSYHVLYEYGIPGIDFQRYYKSNYNFNRLHEYRLNSAAVLSTHDSSFWVNWWKFEAGTIDEKLYELICEKAGIPKGHYNYAKTLLFNKSLSGNGRLYWNSEINSPNIISEILHTQSELISSLIYAYGESFREKEKYIQFLQLNGEFSEITPNLIKRVLESINFSNSIFSIQLLQDYLTLDSELCKKLNKYSSRINTPGTINRNNWSQLQPISLEKLLELEINPVIKEIIKSSGR
ncbi:MAG: 4-alpha-glucanotransferase [Ignavibacteria bacterium]|nr:4-alpha-glucanotransferase [Ignavibacteria bacterium]